MSNTNGLWTLGIQVNRKIGNKVYRSLRLYPPSNGDTELLMKRVQTEGGEDEKLYFTAKIQNHGSRIILDEVQTAAERPTPRVNLTQRADEIISIIAQLGGTTTWPTVREKLGLPQESTPGPFLVKQLRDKGLLTIKNPKTSTMTWKLTDREKLNGWTTH
jgi:hypothetical protein